MTTLRTEVVLAAAFGILAVLTAVRPQWVEVIFGVDPDAGSGALEWAIVAALGVAAALAALLARRSYRRLRIVIRRRANPS